MDYSQPKILSMKVWKVFINNILSSMIHYKSLLIKKNNWSIQDLSFMN
jgi:hypothetical protein